MNMAAERNMHLASGLTVVTTEPL